MARRDSIIQFGKSSGFVAGSFVLWFLIFKGYLWSFLNELRGAVVGIIVFWILSSLAFFSLCVWEWRRKRQSDPEALSFLVGAAVGIALTGFLAYSRYIQPVETEDLLRPEASAGLVLSVRGTVISANVNKNEGYAVFDISDAAILTNGARVTVVTQNLKSIPEPGDSLWSFGRVVLDKRGDFELIEYIRWQ